MPRFVINFTDGDIHAIVFDAESSTVEIYDEPPEEGIDLRKESGEFLCAGYLSGDIASELVRVGTALLKIYDE